MSTMSVRHDDVTIKHNPEVAAASLVKGLVSKALFASDILVGSGRSDAVSDLYKYGIAGYAGCAATQAFAAIGTTAALGVTVFNPVQLADPVEYSAALVSPKYWMNAVNYGASMWGRALAEPASAAAGALLGALRYPAAVLRAHSEDLEKAAADAAGALDPANAPAEPPESPIIPSGAHKAPACPACPAPAEPPAGN